MATIRGQSITSSSASSYTLLFSALSPAVPQAGDTVFLFVGGGWNVASVVTNGVNWTQLDNSPGTNWNGALYSKQMTAGDISTGSVTVTMGGGFDTVLALVAYIGAVNIRAITTQRNGSGSSPIALASAATVQATDHVLLFGSNRANSVDTVDKGTGVVTVSAGNASGVVTEYVPGSAGAFTANFSYATVGSGNYQVTLPVVDPGITAVQASDAGRQTLGSAAASARVSDVARQVLRSSTTAATAVQTSDVTRQTLGSKAAAASVSDVARQTLMGTGARRRKYVLVY